MGANPLNIENTIARSKASKGIMVPYPLWGAGDFFGAADGTALSPSGLSGLADGHGAGLNSKGVATAAWQGTASTTATVIASITLDQAFCEDNKDLIFRFRVRKLDQTGSATDNADLQLRCLIQAIVPDDATTRTIIAAASNTVTLPAKTTAYSWSTWEMDLMSLVTNTTTRGYLQRGTVLVFTFTPQEAVGTDLQAELQPFAFNIRSHAHVAETLSDLEPRY